MNPLTRTLPRPRSYPHAAATALLLAACTLLLWPRAAPAQTAPTAQEVAAYQGLHAAAAHGDLTLLHRTLQAPALNTAQHQALLQARDGNGRTAVHVATFARQRDALRALALAGAPLDALDNERYDAVTIAAVANDAATLDLLLERGASARQTTSRYDGTALIAAAHLGHAGVVRQLIAAGAPLDHVNNLHWTALIESIVLGDGGPRHQATLQALLQAGASTTLTDRAGNTPLQLARQRGYTAMVALMQDAAAPAAITTGTGSKNQKP